MSNPTTKPFKEALDKFIHIGHVYYNGKHHDNVLNIFNDMASEDRYALLRGMYLIYTIVETGSAGESTLIVPVKPQVEAALAKAEETVAAKDQAMGELKLWFLKMVSITVLLGFLFFVIVVFYLGSTLDDTKSMGQTFKILSLLFQ